MYTSYIAWRILHIVYCICCELYTLQNAHYVSCSPWALRLVKFCSYGSDCEHTTGAHLAHVVYFTNGVGYYHHSYYNTLHVIAQGVNRTLDDRQFAC